jgi:iron complex transport system ATP-binding protein
MGGGKLIALGKPETVLDGETLRETYGIDIRKFMLESLENWKTTGVRKGEGGKN